MSVYVILEKMHGYPLNFKEPLAFEGSKEETKREMATERSVAVAVDVDHALAHVLTAALEWHNGEKKTTVTEADLKTADWAKTLAGDTTAVKQWLEDFYQSEPFKTNVKAVDAAAAALKPLRKYYTLLAITSRPRSVEKATREWIDANFGGVFDKLLFVDSEEGKDDVVTRKKELYAEFKVKVAVSADSAVLEKVLDGVPHSVLVGSVPWGKPTTNEKIVKAESWAKAKEALEKIASEMKLPIAAKIANGPKLARYTDDLVTVSTKKPPTFYANMVNTKFAVQKQSSVRLQASEGAITTAVQAAELLKTQKNADVVKISTRYLFKKFRGAPSHRVPAIEIVMHKATAA